MSSRREQQFQEDHELNSEGERIGGDSQTEDQVERLEERAEISAEPGDGTLDELDVRMDQLYMKSTDVSSISTTDLGRKCERDEFEDRLQRANDGRLPGTFEYNELLPRRLHYIDKMRISEAVCDRVELTVYQKDEVLRLMEALELDQFGSQKSISKVALVAIRFVVDRDRMARYGADFERITSDELYQCMLSEFDLDVGDIMRLSSVLKRCIKELSEGELGESDYVITEDPNFPRLIIMDPGMFEEYWGGRL